MLSPLPFCSWPITMRNWNKACECDHRWQWFQVLLHRLLASDKTGHWWEWRLVTSWMRRTVQSSAARLTGHQQNPTTAEVQWAGHQMHTSVLSLAVWTVDQWQNPVLVRVEVGYQLDETVHWSAARVTGHRQNPMRAEVQWADQQSSLKHCTIFKKSA